MGVGAASRRSSNRSGARDRWRRSADDSIVRPPAAVANASHRDAKWNRYRRTIVSPTGSVRLPTGGELLDRGCHGASVQDAPRRPVAARLQPAGSPDKPYGEAVRFRVLGAVELVDPNAGVVVVVGSPNQRRILAVLLARIGEAVPVDTLAEAVWGDDLPASAVATLRTYVSRLRAVLGDSLVSRGAGYALVGGTRRRRRRTLRVAGARRSDC